MLKPNTFYEITKEFWTNPMKGEIFLCLSVPNHNTTYNSYDIVALYKNRICTWCLYERHKNAFEEIK